MTEAEWLVGVHPHRMLNFLRASVSDRKLRLFAVGCCLEVWSCIENEASRNAVLIAEKFADGLASRAELATAGAIAASVAQTACDAVKGIVNVWQSEWAPAQAALTARFASLIEEDGEVTDAMDAANNAVYHARFVAKQKGYVDPLDLRHDIFGNPFRPVAFDPAWRTDTALSLARQMYESREFSAMPILADALQDAGCDHPDVLNHCRDATATHVRGCWVVDLVLGKV